MRARGDLRPTRRRTPGRRSAVCGGTLLLGLRSFISLLEFGLGSEPFGPDIPQQTPREPPADDRGQQAGEGREERHRSFPDGVRLLRLKTSAKGVAWAITLLSGKDPLVKEWEIRLLY